jgi:hypothetical protein
MSNEAQLKLRVNNEYQQLAIKMAKMKLQESIDEDVKKSQELEQELNALKLKMKQKDKEMERPQEQRNTGNCITMTLARKNHPKTK